MHYFIVFSFIALILIPTSNGFAYSDYITNFVEVKKEHWPNAPLPHFMCGQIEQESGWRKNAKLSTKRELGRGLAQITIAYDKTGRERFNTYKDAIKMKELKNWDYKNDPYNVDYQLTYLILKDKANYSQLENLFMSPVDTWAATLVAYNAGMGTVIKRRNKAKLEGKNYDKWFGGLDSIRIKGESSILYGRSLGSMRNEYPDIIINKRSWKYVDVCR